jgi:uncharacterized protein YdaU (DUF1376 family)
MDTASWTVEEVGIYTRLLFYQWVNGSVPVDEVRLARIAGTTTKTFLKWYPQIVLKFSRQDEDNQINLRLEESRIKQETYRNSCKLGGKLTAGKRWGEKKVDSSPISPPISSGNSPSVALQSSTSSSSLKPKTKRALFVIPTLEEIADYCTERRNQIKPSVFLDHYTGNGWMVGKNKMKDWKAVIRTWETRDGGNGNGSKQGGLYEGSRRNEGNATGGNWIPKEYVPEKLPERAPIPKEILSLSRKSDDSAC